MTAFTRELSRIPEGKKKITWKSINVFDSDTIAAVIGGLDLLVSTYQPGNAAKNFNDVVEQSIRNPETYVTAAKALSQALEQYPRLRLIVVGGAGSLEIKRSDPS